MTLDPAVNQETGASGRRYQGITLTGWIRCNCGTHKKQVDVKQLYNLMPQTAWVSWSQFVWVRVVLWGSENQLEIEGLDPQDPGWAAQQNGKRSTAMTRGTWGQYVAVCSVSNAPLTHNPFATLSNKVWEVYFSKELCSYVHYCWLCFRILYETSHIIYFRTIQNSSSLDNYIYIYKRSPPATSG